jgi:hypothetical protein
MRRMVKKTRPPAPAARRAAASENRLEPARWGVLAALAAATIAAFAGAVGNGWVRLDDYDYIVSNPHVNRGWSLADALWFLSHDHASNWHPLTSWIHMLEVQLFGLVPAGHHAVMVALQAADAVLLAYVLSRLTGQWWRSVFVAALFALHPLRVESVAWASELKDVLSGLFFLLTIEAWRRWAAHPGTRRILWVAAFLVLGLLSKPMLVTLPFVLVLLDFWPLGRVQDIASLRRSLLEKAPLFALVVLSSVATVLAQRAGGAVISHADVPLTSRVTNALVSCCATSR